MQKNLYTFTLIQSAVLILLSNLGFAQQLLNGFVIDSQTRLPISHASVFIPKLKKGAISDSSGRFSLEIIEHSLPLVVEVQHVGYRSHRDTLHQLDTQLIFELSPLSMQEVIVSGNRTAESIQASSYHVQRISRQTLEQVQAVSVLEGLNFQAGIRTEINCQTCNYSQVRLNGLPGAYSQILLNSRPVFSNLLTLYGLEQIPAELIERVEIVRGGGSALFGANAIGGSLNLIMRRPITNSFQAQYQHTLTGGYTPDSRFQAHLTQAGKHHGWLISTQTRSRQAFDANNDGFSEIPQISQQSHMLSGYWDIGRRHELNLQLINLQEERNGGDQLQLPPHMRQQSEWRQSHTFAGTLDWQFDIDYKHRLQAFAGWQHTKRRHYTGFEGDEGYGRTQNFSYQSGVQHTYLSPSLQWKLHSGVELLAEYVFDQIPAYDYLIDQYAVLGGAFAEAEWQPTQRWKIAAGQRLSYHNLARRWYWTPRASIRFEARHKHILRLSYAEGFRPPQAFDADMHMAFADGDIVRIQVDPTLRSEYARSLTASLDADYPKEHYIAGFSLVGFYTRLQNPFILEDFMNAGDGQRILLRTNGENAHVYGISVEGRLNWLEQWEARSGWTLQENYYDQAVMWSEDAQPTTAFLRTPNLYGYFMLNYIGSQRTQLSLSGVYTGRMLVPHFGSASNINEDRLEHTPSFWDINLRLAYFIKLPQGLRAELMGGIYNLLNAYQRDFDIGPERDSDYIYGPARPRSPWLGIRVFY